jgi:hypothetical protein
MGCSSVTGSVVIANPNRVRTGAPGSPKRTWAENDGALAPTTAFIDPADTDKVTG